MSWKLIREWSIVDQEPVWQASLAFDHDAGELVAAVYHQRQEQLWITRWSLVGEGAAPVRRFELPGAFSSNAYAASVMLSPDLTWIATGDGNPDGDHPCGCRIALWELESRRLVRCYESAHDDSIDTLLFLRDGELLLSHGGLVTLVHSTASGQLVGGWQYWFDGGRLYRDIGASNQGHLIVQEYSDAVNDPDNQPVRTIADFSSHRQLSAFPRGLGELLGFSADDSVVMTADGPEIAFWDWHTWDLVDHVVWGSGAYPVKWPIAVALSPDGEWLAAVDMRGHARVFSRDEANA